MSSSRSEPKLSFRQKATLDYIIGHKGCTAYDIGIMLRSDATARSASASGAGIAWGLIRKGLVERKLIRHELFGYYARVSE